MKVISLFSGCGGLDLGLIRAGHQVVWANDILEDACETYRRNIGKHIDCGDVRKVKFKDLPKCDVVVGGFPCQGFSIANMNRRENDPRNMLYRQFLRALKEVQPKYFFAENVRGILSLEKGEVFKKILRDFESTGYVVQFKLFNVADYGVPQNRYRVILFGCRSDLPYMPPFDITPSHGKGRLPHKTIGEALKNIPEPNGRHQLTNHVCSQYKLKNTGYINHRPVDPRKPAPTVTARGDTKGGAMINHHPNNTRRLSVRETAIIQSFPIDFEFVGNMTSCYMQIGNAVPPLFGEVLGAFLKNVAAKRRYSDDYRKLKQEQLSLFRVAD